MELEEPAEPVTGELEVVDSVGAATGVDSVEATMGIDSVEDSVEATTVLEVEAIKVPEVVVAPPAGPEGDGPVSAGDEGVDGPDSAGDEGVGWEPVDCPLVICPCVVGVGVDLSVDLVMEKPVEVALVTVLEAELQSKEMVGMETEQVEDSWGMLEPVWPLG